MKSDYYLIDRQELIERFDIDEETFSDFIMDLYSEGYTPIRFYVSDRPELISTEKDAIIETNFGYFYWKKNGDIEPISTPFSGEEKLSLILGNLSRYYTIISDDDAVDYINREFGYPTAFDEVMENVKEKFGESEDISYFILAKPNIRSELQPGGFDILGILSDDQLIELEATEVIDKKDLEDFIQNNPWKEMFQVDSDSLNSSIEKRAADDYYFLDAEDLIERLDITESDLYDLIHELGSDGYNVLAFYVNDSPSAISDDKDVLIGTDYGHFFWNRDGSLTQAAQIPRSVAYQTQIANLDVGNYYQGCTAEEFENYLEDQGLYYWRDLGELSEEITRKFALSADPITGFLIAYPKYRSELAAGNADALILLENGILVEPADLEKTTKEYIESLLGNQTLNSDIVMPDKSEIANTVREKSYYRVSIEELKDRLDVSEEEIKDAINELEAEGYNFISFAVSDDEDVIQSGYDVIVLTDSKSFYWKPDGNLEIILDNIDDYIKGGRLPIELQKFYDLVTANDVRDYLDENTFREILQFYRKTRPNERIVGWILSKPRYRDWFAVNEYDVGVILDTGEVLDKEGLEIDLEAVEFSIPWTKRNEELGFHLGKK